MRIIKIFLSLFLTVAPLFFGTVYFFITQANKNGPISIYFANKQQFYNNIKRVNCYKFHYPFFVVAQFLKDSNFGEYEISHNETVLDFLKKIMSRHTIIHKFHVVEGQTAYEIMKKLKQCSELVGDFEEFKDGDIFPDTYHYSKGTKRNTLVQIMKNKMKSVLSSIQNKTKLSINEVITLASIIEHEAANTGEMRLISSVLHNRLNINMRLQSDVTVIYAASGHTGILHNFNRSHFAIDDPYNTYKNKGLPPGPICCPGKNALIAACDPAKTDYLYFISNDTRTASCFSKTFKEHFAYKKKFDELIKKRKNTNKQSRE